MRSVPGRSPGASTPLGARRDSEPLACRTAGQGFGLRVSAGQTSTAPGPPRLEPAVGDAQAVRIPPSQMPRIGMRSRGTFTRSKDWRSTSRYLGTSQIRKFLSPAARWHRRVRIWDAVRPAGELAVHIHSDIPDHPVLPSPIDRWGTAGTERHLRIRARSAAGPVAGRPTTNMGSQPTEQERPAHTCSPKAPVPDGRTVCPTGRRTSRTTRGPPRHFIPGTNAIESVNARLRKVTRNRGHFPLPKGRAEGALPGRAEPAGVLATKRRDPNHRLETSAPSVHDLLRRRHPHTLTATIIYT
jgi:hypothetical protein